MSVPKWKRNPNETLDLFMESMEFCIHILKITKNEKIFTPEIKEDITDRLKKDAIDIYTSLWIANTNSLSRYPKERRELQRKAQNCITDFMCMCISRKNIKRRKKKIRSQGKHSTLEEFENSYKTWRSYASKGTNKKILSDMDKYYNKYKEIYYDGEIKNVALANGT